MRMNAKISIVIGLFAVFITAALIGGVYMWQSSLQQEQVINSSIAVLNDVQYQNVAEGSSITISSNDLVASEAVDSLYFSFFFKNLPMIMLAICGIILLATGILWMILRNIYLKQTVAIIDELKLVNDGYQGGAIDGKIGAALQRLRKSFATNLEDYKRLGSYMTHDQKNIIAILRSNLEQKSDANYELDLLDQLTNSVDDILTLSNNQEAVNEKVDVAMVCAEVCDEYRKFYPTIQFDFDEQMTTEILGRNRWIYRAVSNLLDNAIKYGNQEPVEVRVTNEHNSVIVKVHDHGLGIPKRQQAQVFDHHYRIKGLKQDGYGIGLSVVAHVCDLCSGYAFVESSEREGTSFYLSFPV